MTEEEDGRQGPRGGLSEPPSPAAVSVSPGSGDVDLGPDPERVAHFRILCRMGSGGMGVVYRAEDETLRRTVALKLLPAALSHDDERRQRFLREARSAAATNHPNVAVVHQIGEADGRVYIAMELVEGESLRDRLLRGRLGLVTGRDIALQIARGLAAAHDKGLVHRDLKPENVMITPTGVVKLLDFGLAKVGIESPRSGVTAFAATEPRVTIGDGRVMGTPEYMSPEQALGDPLDVRSDLFSFGVLAYEMFSGVRPFTGDMIIQVLASIVRDAPVPLRERAHDVDEATESIVMRCLAKAPGQRFANGAELASALSGQRSPRATTESRLDVTPLTRSTPVRAMPRRRRLGVVLGACALVAAVVVGLVLRGRSTATLVAHGVPVAPPEGVVPASPRGTLKFTDLPAPASSSAEAVAAYGEGMRAQRDGLNVSYRSFYRALALDPTMAAARLRLVEIFLGAHQRGIAREQYRDLLAHLDRLSARDRAITAAIEPAALSDPPDWMEAARRLRALHEAEPGDLGDLLLLGRVSHNAGDGAGARAALESAVQADPEFGVAFGELVRLAVDEHRDADAHATAERCLHAVPRATDCLDALAGAEATAGQCTQALADGRRFIAISPEDRWGYTFVASSLAALGEPWDSVSEAIAQSNERQFGSDTTRAAWALERLSSLRVLQGDFTGALAQIDEIESQHLEGEQQFFNPRTAVVERRVELALERGDVARAARVADGYLRRRGAFAPPELADDPVPLLLDVERAAGTLGAQALGARMDEWRSGWREHFGGAAPAQLWVVGDARVARTRDEALTALASRPPLDQLPNGFRFEIVGRVSGLGGRYGEAATLLAQAASDCMVLERPFVAVRANLELGRIAEQSGDTASACGHYGRVLQRWGHATPRSVTADEARERSRQLRCP